VGASFAPAKKAASFNVYGPGKPEGLSFELVIQLCHGVRSLVSVSDHLGAVANQVRKPGLGTPLPYNLNMPDDRQRGFSPVGDRFRAEPTDPFGPVLNCITSFAMC
jgi:hypothetical protein